MKEYRILNKSTRFIPHADPTIDEHFAQKLLVLGHTVQSRDIGEWEDIV
jgi:hypothetical protein